MPCRFATLLETGLLLYNGRYNERHDFIALELVEGGRGVQFSFSLGSDVTRVVARSAREVNDGHWHTVTVNYFNKVHIEELLIIDSIYISSKLLFI